MSQRLSVYRVPSPSTLFFTIEDCYGPSMHRGACQWFVGTECTFVLVRAAVSGQLRHLLCGCAHGVVGTCVACMIIRRPFEGEEKGVGIGMVLKISFNWCKDTNTTFWSMVQFKYA